MALVGGKIQIRTIYHLLLMSRKQFNICKQLSTTDRRKEKE